MNEVKLPNIIKEKVEEILNSDEQIQFTSKGRIEFTETSIIGSVLFWFKYILLNYIFIFCTGFYKQKAYLVVTTKRVMIFTDEGINFPFWIVPFSRHNENYIYQFSNVSSVMGRESKNFWFFSSKGFEIESTGSKLISFNGVNKEDYKEGFKVFSKTNFF